MAALGVFQRRTEISDAPGIAALIDAGSRTEELFGDINIVTAMYAPHQPKRARCLLPTRSCPPPDPSLTPRALWDCAAADTGASRLVFQTAHVVVIGTCNWRWGKGFVCQRARGWFLRPLCAHSAKRADSRQLSRPGVRLQAPA